MSYLAAQAQSRLKRAVDGCRLITELAQRCDAAITDTGLAGEIHGVPARELVRQYAQVCAAEAAKVKLALDALTQQMDKDLRET